MNTLNIPLFPLQTVLFPGGPLLLRIFEPRYLSMISSCLKQSRPFGVCLIRQGSETGAAAEPHSVGTLATIIDWNRLPDGLLGITAEGGERFEVEATSIEQDQLTTAEIALIPDDPVQPVPPEFATMVELLKEIINQAGPTYAALEFHFDNASWVGFRLAELLPLESDFKQKLLEMTSPWERLRLIQDTVEELVES